MQPTSSYTAGQKVTLSWSASIDHNKSTYTLWYSPDAGANWSTVKSKIPGQASNVAVNHEWTVPSQPTTRGMIRVFQDFGGTVATNPSSPGDYTLFSTQFEIKSVSGRQAPTAVRERSSWIRSDGHRISLGILDQMEKSASLEIRSLDGSLLEARDLGQILSSSAFLEIPRDARAWHGQVVVQVRIAGRPLVQALVVFLP